MKEPIKVAGWTVAEDLSGDQFEDVAISLVDLHRTRLRKGEAHLQGVSFLRCRIEGPAVMLVVGGCTFNGVNFGAKKGMDTLILRPQSKSGVVGAIPVLDCVFRDCEMFGVGFTGPSDFLDELLTVKGPVQ